MADAPSRSTSDPSKPTDPRARMGVYKSLEDVPARYQLDYQAEAFADRDVWAEFMAVETDQFDSDRFLRDARLAEDSWKEHMVERGRHHALATPADVETWCDGLLDRMTVERAYNAYWIRVERLYDWLQWHREFPHVYHPVLMAAAAGDAAGHIWEAKLRTYERDQ